MRPVIYITYDIIDCWYEATRGLLTLFFDHLRTLNVKYSINNNAKSSFMRSLLIYGHTTLHSVTDSP